MSATTATLDPADRRFVLDGMDWQAYDALLHAVGDHHVFVTYDRGRVELMYPSFEHENRSEIIGLLIRSIAEGLTMKVKGGGSTTFRREDIDRGLEPDKCFYVANEAKVRGKTNIDLSLDPPPDLCVEVEISRRLLNRPEIYASLGVPELWRDDGKHLRIFALSPHADYRQCDRSITFPELSADQLNELLDASHVTDETSWATDVRAYARKLRQQP